MSLKHISTDQAPAAIGPYSQAIVANGLVYTAGSIPLVPSTMTIIEGGIQEQTKQALENLQHVLSAAGSDFSKVIKTTIFLKVCGLLFGLVWSR
jgi:2-iminobutanoate/2-iminopropanoate deaminase